MLVRDFIHDSLYNPSYGYFSKKALIFSPEESFAFNEIRHGADFQEKVAEYYKVLESHDGNRLIPSQIWHTPTELFKPWYGRAFARYMVAEHLRTRLTSEEPLIIYEIGAGNGTFMLNVLDYIKEHHEDVYQRTQYTIIEISAQLSHRQTEGNRLRDARRTHPNLRVVNQSIFDWKDLVPDRCFFVAMEVIDNFAHDLVRYSLPDPSHIYQGLVLVNENGEYSEAYAPFPDGLLSRYLDLRQHSRSRPTVVPPPWRARLRNALPFAPNMTDPEWCPTMLLKLFEKLRDKFPRHRLVLSDFSSLPDTVPGLNGPVVQTRYAGTMVPCSTYLVQPGWFDIFFPTDFEVMRDMYLSVCRPGDNAAAEAARVVSHGDFLGQWGELERTRTKSGENPMVDFYENVKVFVT
ncbi:DUF185-domain-containing protein [Gonapodya prolifera JEL478]|uniref:Protein arginine methyltransferase NDUFAF7 n=1 Tax=Gonapodya prolifera (strain JEL478) TaxID=1344416 RepID=A0A139AZY7_GONPJ|nr:DUF185-domain-containing protein [Gonapodya prolifera JEL478]|eukprot:KXS22301.1 DUF185-domain-containing protein [Gonapodya prolifera JEL478]